MAAAGAHREVIGARRLAGLGAATGEARQLVMGDLMVDEGRTPDTATMCVALSMAQAVIERMAARLAQELVIEADARAAPGEEDRGEKLLTGVLEEATAEVDLQNWTDETAYDRDFAKAIALDTIEQSVRVIRSVALHTPLTGQDDEE